MKRGELPLTKPLIEKLFRLLFCGSKGPSTESLFSCSSFGKESNSFISGSSINAKGGALLLANCLGASGGCFVPFSLTYSLRVKVHQKKKTKTETVLKTTMHNFFATEAFQLLH